MFLRIVYVHNIMSFIGKHVSEILRTPISNYGGI